MIIEKGKYAYGVAYNKCYYAPASKYRTTFKIANTIYNVFVPDGFKAPSLYKAELINQKEEPYIVKDYRFLEYVPIDKFPFLSFRNAKVEQVVPPQTFRFNHLIVMQKECYFCRLNITQLIAFATSTFKVFEGDLVRLGIVRRRSNSKRMLYAFVLQKW